VSGRRDAAEHHVRQAVTLAPATADSLGLQAGQLARAGRTAEAIAMAERARALDPLSVNRPGALASVLRAAGQRDRAVAELRKAIQLEPVRPNLHFQLGATHAVNGDIEAAIVEFERAIALSNVANPRFRAYLAHAYARNGRREDARHILDELLAMRRRQYVSSFGIALIHDALGAKDAAMAALERAFQEHAVELIQLSQYPPLRTLTSEPRYQELMRSTSSEP
jgi:tetratricopeptide (TPR) repeat protein